VETDALMAARELAVEHEYDTVDRDLERLGMRVVRLPSEAGVVWRVTLPRGEQVEEWEPGTHGLVPPEAIVALFGAVAAGKELVPAPPRVDDPGARRLRDMLEAQRRALLAHDPGVRVASDPENLHQHRVAARRTRAFLRAARPYVDPAWRRSITGPLAELGRTTGAARDLDVLLEHVRPLAATVADAERPGADALVSLLAQTRERAQADLVAALDDESYRTVLARLQLPPRLRRGMEAIPLDRVAREEFDRLARSVARLGKRPGPAQVHAMRISLKRARYAAELALPRRRAGKRFLEAARELQELLGEYQDSVVAERLLCETAVGNSATSAAFVAGRLAERQAARRERVEKRLPASWRRLRKRASAR
jgi:CHAD domain-containing protein